ncbi:MAG: hypothetical protein M3Q27_03815 [Actinomycetota bacterium]|nr:hypothetical protein [Actinomycetota bacterium]
MIRPHVLSTVGTTLSGYPTARGVTQGRDAVSRARRWWSRLRAGRGSSGGPLLYFFGPPQVGPYGNAPPPAPQPRACPACGRPFDEHRVDRSTGVTRVHCPDGG